MMFDWSISTGNLLTIGSFIVGTSFIISATKSRVDAISTRLLSFENEIRRLTDILIAQGRQEERMTALDARLGNQGSRLDDLLIRFNKRLDPL